MITAVTELPDADPLASVSAQFALTGSSFEQSTGDMPSPDGVRPWGLRHAVPAGAGRVLPEWNYDAEQQKAVDGDGVPLIDRPRMGPPTAHTTASTDGEDPPSAEDWIND
ncbi:putative ATP-grasp-modified RiPP [Allokutzneria sp. A3M-2-11 16]|uniref:putative ATP-grasp-modified RiPP n=1 Tax=Allokutzneria sp. A3M-2-11 16 TaxID=2962043 RepID=UPI0020B6DEBE|nr:putative ATP-grasp-modified RiPP [Allokutzneria sp. A3M-2-11 16]MCP3799730.1 putative ATP-grasp-modified RiPP [Allokutzneria sp. A3M-2-11 16]